MALMPSEQLARTAAEEEEEEEEHMQGLYMFSYLIQSWLEESYYITRSLKLDRDSMVILRFS